MTLSKKEKRIAKLDGRTVKSFRAIHAYKFYFFHPKVFPSIIRFAWCVLKDFFALQFNQKFSFKKIPVINVDHPLDSKIPFNPAKIKTYLDFINFWIRPFALLTDRIGVHRTAPLLKKWVDLIHQEYYEASRMYRYRLSTTERPKYHRGLFSVIHSLDPHLCCVPSLHIAILALFYAYMKNIFKDETFTEKERFLWTTETYNYAIEIAESVLYVKQHSVNCIPAALYMVTRLYPDMFTPTDATNFINDMFLSATDIDFKDASAIREHISFSYECFLLEGCITNDWRDPVKKWINSYSFANSEQK